MDEWKRDVASGLVVLVPLLISLYAIAWLFSFLAGLPLTDAIENPLARVAVTLAVFVLAVALVGMATRTAGGALASGWLDTAINRVPLLRVVYNASQLAVETVVSGDTELKEPVKVTTWMGARMTAFKTGRRSEDGRMVLFVPTAPNVTTGYVVEIDPADVEPTDETVEEAMTRLLSAGFGDQPRPEAAPLSTADD
ncbi:DUF502 domain-containing protein [Halalkalicoccus jeotgali]|uniref:DUF502 domain-containing protein n=1 Tax=Halalkalicoccus jeotgali (strain DSM 18796 / CECT 7217 / JCM 14584 / KCTC 4019 / B3) TaxID=795797 RepID=D8J3Q8_HALJB|nr:DUF502 domain-containing protein [Halalkalicoccus jeotgali]ADJ13399.1 hypothetical protein HacjB3_00030 [Halalkalicoccus jeotgali B3]ELY32769.1 hypothetical protein C497_19309 [Halalkalicoccus jeotgali B3]